MANEYKVNGVSLDHPQGWWSVLQGTTVPSLGAPKNVSVEVPNRNGVMDIGPAAAGPAEVTIQMLIVPPDGGGWGEMDHRMHEFLQRVRRFGEMVELSWQPPGALERVAKARLSASIQPKLLRQSWGYTFPLAFEIPSGVWKERQWFRMSSLNLSALNGTGMPISDAKFRLKPTQGLMQVTDRASGKTFSWRGQMQGSKSLVVDPGRYVAGWVDGDASWDSGGEESNRISLGVRGFALTANPAGEVAVDVTGGTVEVYAARSF